MLELGHIPRSDCSLGIAALQLRLSYKIIKRDLTGGVLMVDSDPGRCSPEHHCHHREDNNHQGMEEYGQWLISQKKQ